jgi:hypothetical protein
MSNKELFIVMNKKGKVLIKKRYKAFGEEIYKSFKKDEIKNTDVYKNRLGTLYDYNRENLYDIYLVHLNEDISLEDNIEVDINIPVQYIVSDIFKRALSLLNKEELKNKKVK